MVDYRLRKAEEAEAELEAAEELRALRLAMGGTMSLNVALEFASCGYAVLPVSALTNVLGLRTASTPLPPSLTQSSDGRGPALLAL
ncbi:MAG: hypothetical protein WB019_08770 [Pseudolabrys sp.]